MMQNISFTDTHIHLYSEEFQSDLQSLIRAAYDAGVKRMLLPNIDVESIGPMLDLTEKHSDWCFPMIGLHPCYVKEDYLQQLEVVRKALLENKSVVKAVGEIGLDFHWDLTYKKQQEEAFLTQLQWAEEFDLPISIHARKSTEEIIQLIKHFGIGKITGVFHCFSGSMDQAQQVIKMGFKLGIGGVVTFPKATMAEVVVAMPLNSLLLETDGPYLAPVPHRGKRNEPAYLRLIAEKVAELKGVSLEEVAQVTSANAANLFGL